MISIINHGEGGEAKRIMGWKMVEQYYVEGNYDAALPPYSLQI